MTAIHDLVLVHVEGRPNFFARVEDISPDVKPGWWQVKLLVLTVPMQLYTWILDDQQINGQPFTMGGTPVQLEKVESPLADQPVSETPAKGKRTTQTRDGGGSKVVPLFQRKKEDQ